MTRDDAMTDAADPIGRLRAADLRLLENGRTYVLFNPDTLRIVRVSRSAAALVADCQAGLDADAIAARRGLTPSSLAANLAAVARVVAAADERAAPAPASALRRRAPLARAALIVNNYCNLRCEYCYERKDLLTGRPKDMPLDVMRCALDALYETFGGIDQVMFIGGEPSLSEQVIVAACAHATDLARASEVRPPGFALSTNGVRVSDALLAAAATYGIQFTFSVDGPALVHDRVRVRHDGSGTHTQVMSCVERYAARLPGRAHAECTISRAHDRTGVTIDDVLDFCARELGVASPHVTLAALRSDDPLDPYAPPSGLPGQFDEAVARSVDSILGLLPAEFAGAREARLDFAVAMVDRLVRRRAKATMCAASDAQLAVDPSGDLYPCWMFAGNPRFRLGNVRQDGLFDGDGARVLASFAQNTKAANPTCRTCVARGVCNVCLGNNYNTTGTVEQADERFCHTVRAALRTIVLRLAERPVKPVASIGRSGREGTGGRHADC